MASAISTSSRDHNSQVAPVLVIPLTTQHPDAPAQSALDGRDPRQAARRDQRRAIRIAIRGGQSIRR
jgi:hypothetical protein